MGTTGSSPQALFQTSHACQVNAWLWALNINIAYLLVHPSICRDLLAQPVSKQDGAVVKDFLQHTAKHVNLQTRPVAWLQHCLLCQASGSVI